MGRLGRSGRLVEEGGVGRERVVDGCWGEVVEECRKRAVEERREFFG